MNTRRWLWLSVIGNGIFFVGLVGLLFLITQLRVDVAEQRQLVEKRDAQKVELEKQLALTQKQLETALAQVQELTAQKQAEYVPASVYQAGQGNLPWFPANISFRKALLGQGDVLILENPTSQSIPFRLDVYSISRDTGKTLKGIVSARGKAEIGHLEGWAFLRGDKLLFESPGFRPYEYTVD